MYFYKVKTIFGNYNYIYSHKIYRNVQDFSIDFYWISAKEIQPITLVQFIIGRLFGKIK